MLIPPYITNEVMVDLDVLTVRVLYWINIQSSNQSRPWSLGYPKPLCTMRPLCDAVEEFWTRLIKTESLKVVEKKTGGIS